MNTKVLAPEHLACFEKQGYVHIREAFRRANALAMQEFMWSRLKALHNIERSDRSTWSDNTNGLNKSAKASVYSGIGSHRLCSTINQLLGPGAWQVPKSWGGFLITFPQGSRDSWELTRKNWHWDGKPSDHFKALNGLFILMLFSHIEPRGGGTLLLSGSHQLISRFVEAGRQKQKPINLNRFRLSHPWIAELAGMKSRIKDRNERLQYFMQKDTEVDGVSVRVIEVTGEPGDVFLCHPSIFHAASFNHSDVPRFMRVKRIAKRGMA